MKNYQGWTLIELIIVIALLGILAAFVIPRQTDDQAILAASAHQLATNIRLTQALAMQRMQRFRINFFTDHYRITDISAAALYIPPTQITADIALQSGITMTTAHFFIVFDSHGVPYIDANMPGTVLASDAVITLSSPHGHQQQLIINPETGAVSD